MFENTDPSPEIVERIRQDERSRIRSIMTMPEAMGREHAATALALDGLSIESAKRALSLIPLPGIGVAADAGGIQPHAEIGPSGGPTTISSEAAKAGWKKVTAEVNQHIRGDAGATIQVRG